MAARSLLTLGLLATAAIAAPPPPPGYGPPPPPPPPGGPPPPPGCSDKTVTKTKTKTENYTTTKTKKVTHTVTESATCSAMSPSMYTTTPSTTACVCPTYSMMSCPTGMSSSSIYSNSSMMSTMTTTSSTAVNTNPTTTIVATATATGYGLNDAAKAAGKLWVGTAADIPGTGEAQDPYYMAEFNNTHDFGESTPANTMKFFAVEPEQNVFNFTGGDYFLDLAAAAGKQVRCHNLVWKSQLADWVTSPTVPWTNATLLAAMRNHITKTIAHFGDRCYSWDVVNEAFADNPAGAFDNSSIFYDVIGEEYLFQAFDAAQKAVADNGLSVKLYYNDYNIENPGAKSSAAQAAVKQMKDRGIQIDGVGLESHFIAGSTPSMADQQANMEAFVALDVDVAVTELDVRLDLPPTAASEAQQKVDYYNTAAACAAVERCIGLVVWDFDDTYSWIPSTFPGQGYGDIFFQPGGANTPLVKKAAYDGILEAFMGVAEVPV